MSSIKNQIESLLFISGRALSAAKITSLVKSKTEEVKKALDELYQDYQNKEGGIKLFENHGDWQLGTTPENSSLIANFLQEELSGELTRPQLETLTIIAYRGPLEKSEMEQIRGVNCGLILRNLLIRGLIEVKEETKEKIKIIRFTVTLDFLKFLGLTSVKKLPRYEFLHSHEAIVRLLETPTL